MLGKQADTPVKSNVLTGRLIASRSGWILLEVPNAIVHGLFASMHAPGIELPKHKKRLNAHISVMRPEEVESVGGQSAITETGKRFSYQLGPLKEVKPMGWVGVSKVWFVEVASPELETLRKTYGLPPLPTKNGKTLHFHLTVAVRRNNVLFANEVAKEAAAQDEPWPFDYEMADDEFISSRES
jgi:hypothetical protein